MLKTILVIVTVSCLAGQTTSDSGNSLGTGLNPSGSRCEEITIPMCRGINYNFTSFPNEFNHDTQDEAGLEVHQYWPLVEIKCSPDLKFFLCSIYTPICLEDYPKPLPPCRSLCERARAGCAPVMQKYDFPWPEKMACERLPVFGDSENLCMDSELGAAAGAQDPPTTKPTRKSHQHQPSLTRPICKGKNSKNCREPPGEGPVSGECSCRCRPPLVPLAGNRSGVRIAGVADCAYPCRGAFFSGEEREFAAIWVALWSGLCAASTLMTVTTFLIDPQRFKYPERPIAYLSACYFMVSIGYLTRVFLGHEEVACDGAAVRHAASGPGACTLVFLLVYFFGMASSAWWVVLSFTWFLAAGLKWGNEAIAGYSQYFHLAAWLIPAGQSIGALLSAAVDGDPVAGICYVGNLDPENLKRFVIGPLLVYLAAGTSFLLAGFVSLFRIRSVIKRQGGAGAGSKADKLEKLMIRIGIFSVLYTVPAAAVLGCYLYEATLHDAWLRRWMCSCSSSVGSPNPPSSRPLYALLMLKYFMALAVGITSGVWIWSGKTLDSWRRFCRRAFGIGSGGVGAGGAGAALIKPRIHKPPGIPVPRPPPPRSHV